MRTILGTMLAFAACAPLSAMAAESQPANLTPFQQRIIEAQRGEIRTEAERARDVNRLPAEILGFFRMREDMRVIEILPAGGWFTKLLAPALKDRGKLYVTHPEGRYADQFRQLKSLPGMERVEEIPWGAAAGGAGAVFGPSGKWNVAPVDMVLTFRNYHNFSVADRATVNKSAFDALKPGGYYGIVDHTRRHNEPENRTNRRRVDPVRVIKEVQDAGFELVDFSDIYFRPGDALALEVADPSINDRTDRIALLFRKRVAGP